MNLGKVIQKGIKNREKFNKLLSLRISPDSRLKLFATKVNEIEPSSCL